MSETDLLDQVIRQDELSCLGSTEALQDVCSKVFIMVRLRQKHHSRIHRGSILAATESPMAPEVASCDEAVAVNTQLHVVRALRPTFQEQRVPVRLCRLVAIFYHHHVIFVFPVDPEALDELFLETKPSTVHRTVCIRISVICQVVNQPHLASLQWLAGRDEVICQVVNQLYLATLQ